MMLKQDRMCTCKVILWRVRSFAPWTRLRSCGYTFCYCSQFCKCYKILLTLLGKAKQSQTIIAVISRTHMWTLSWARLIHSTSSRTIFRWHFILTFHLHPYEMASSYCFVKQGKGKGKGTAIPILTWTDPDCSRRFRLLGFKTVGSLR